MANPYADYQKTGMDKLIKLAKVLCRLVQTFKVIIDAKFPDSVAIQALVAAILLLCPLIADADAEFQEYQLDMTLPPADVGDSTGINPDAPAAVAPDFT
jgi:hypothetical protein